MQYVLDQNMSRTPILEQYLCNGHEIILIDDFFVEIFKADNPIPIFERNIEIIKKYPSSIFYCKCRGDLIREEIAKGAPLSKNELLCERNTEKIRTLISLDKHQLALEIPSFKSESQKRFEESNGFSEEFIRKLSGKVNSLDIKQYMDNSNLLEEHIFQVAISSLGDYLKDKCFSKLIIEGFKSKKSVLFIQNYILLWRVLDWALKKGYQNAKNLSNDNFDLKYVLSSCFFDGLLTKEQWLTDCRASALSSIKYMATVQD